MEYEPIGCREGDERVGEGRKSYDNVLGNSLKVVMGGSLAGGRRTGRRMMQEHEGEDGLKDMPA